MWLSSIIHSIRFDVSPMTSIRSSTTIILFITTFVSITQAQVSLGCFATDTSPSIRHKNTLKQQGDMIFSIFSNLWPSLDDINMSQGLCSEFCKKNKFSYSITTSGSICYCSKDFSFEEYKVEDSKCDQLCMGHPLETCGSKSLVSDSKGGGNTFYVNIMLNNDQSTIPELRTALETGNNQGSVNIAGTEILRRRSRIEESSDEDEGEDENEDSRTIEGSGENSDENDESSEDDDESGDENENLDSEDTGNPTDSNGDKSTPPSSTSSTALPIASISVAVVCGIGIITYICYLARRKRRRQRSRAAWVNSAFGTSPEPHSGNMAVDHYHNNPSLARHTSFRQHPHDDLESNSDNQSEIIDRQHLNQHRASVMTSNSYSRAIRASVLTAPPPATRVGKESIGRNSSRNHQDQRDYYSRSRNRQTLPNILIPNSDRYQEFYEPKVYHNDPSIAIPTSAFSLDSPQRARSHQKNFSPVSPHSIQHHHHHHHPLDYGGTSIHPLDRHGLVNQHEDGLQMDQPDCNDPFRDVPSHRHPPVHPNPRAHSRPQHQTASQRHTLHLATNQTSIPIPNRRPSVVSEYRRPHSFAIGSSGDLPGNFRTHVLDENDTQSECTDAEEDTMTLKQMSLGKVSGSLKHHFKRLSLPYVQAIRQQQQQQHPYISNKDTFNLVEDGNGDIGYSNGSSMEGHPIPGPAPTTGRRWSRNFLKSVVGNGNNNKAHLNDTAMEGKEGYIEEVCGDDVEAQIEAIRKGHRQVNTGSLASFRGLDDPNNPRLRVMNPDDGAF